MVEHVKRWNHLFNGKLAFYFVDLTTVCNSFSPTPAIKPQSGVGSSHWARGLEATAARLFVASQSHVNGLLDWNDQPQTGRQVRSLITSTLRSTTSSGLEKPWTSNSVVVDPCHTQWRLVAHPRVFGASGRSQRISDEGLWDVGPRGPMPVGPSPNDPAQKRPSPAASEEVHKGSSEP